MNGGIVRPSFPQVTSLLADREHRAAGRTASLSITSVTAHLCRSIHKESPRP
ncbi:predicted protein [Streptomyces viridosporus ATCC 14672]|uniref:Predicted protein n=1 Tax=Streptomyces viridosporus (strain ATCC 14672 / DSM 40746 / JCM 4963 / KCTC 9882 / NRRL B-12104 / FH 1290) TaxID=566461 RepID=D6A586_STRV1|nr:predicted protein [Streptomyces viridosporus ATCC 14672]